MINAIILGVGYDLDTNLVEELNYLKDSCTYMDMKLKIFIEEPTILNKKIVEWSLQNSIQYMYLEDNWETLIPTFDTREAIGIVLYNEFCFRDSVISKVNKLIKWGIRTSLIPCRGNSSDDIIHWESS